MLCRGYHGLLANIYLDEFDQKMDRRGVYTRVHRNFLMKGILQRWNEWLRCRICIFIWKQWKNPKIRGQNLKKLGIPAWQACQWGAGLGYWKVSNIKRSYTHQKPGCFCIQVFLLYCKQPPTGGASRGRLF